MQECEQMQNEEPENGRVEHDPGSKEPEAINTVASSDKSQQP